jgi:hypothetical protein
MFVSHEIDLKEDALYFKIKSKVKNKGGKKNVDSRNRNIDIKLSHARVKDQLTLTGSRSF